jgi:hypothetical protein
MKVAALFLAWTARAPYPGVSAQSGDMGYTCPPNMLHLCLRSIRRSQGEGKTKALPPLTP